MVQKIRELNLEDYHDSFFYQGGNFENLGLNDNTHDYYVIYENSEEMEKHILDYKLNCF